MYEFLKKLENQEDVHLYNGVMTCVSAYTVDKLINEVKNRDEFESCKVAQDRYAFIAGDMTDSSTIPQANENRIDSSISVYIVEHVIFSDGTMSNW